MAYKAHYYLAVSEHNIRNTLLLQATMLTFIFMYQEKHYCDICE